MLGLIIFRLEPNNYVIFTNTEKGESLPVVSPEIAEFWILIKCRNCNTEQLAYFADLECSGSELKIPIGMITDCYTSNDWKCINCGLYEHLHVMFEYFEDYRELALYQFESSECELVGRFNPHFDFLDKRLKRFQKDYKYKIIKQTLRDDSFNNWEDLLKLLMDRVLRIDLSNGFTVFACTKRDSEVARNESGTLTNPTSTYWITGGQYQKTLFENLAAIPTRHFEMFINLIEDLIQIKTDPDLNKFKRIGKNLRILRYVQGEIEKILSIDSIISYIEECKRNNPKFRFEYNEIIHETFILLENFYRERGTVFMIYSTGKSADASKVILNELIHGDADELEWTKLHNSLIINMIKGLPVYISLFRDRNNFTKIYVKIPPLKEMDKELINNFVSLDGYIVAKFAPRLANEDILAIPPLFFRGLIEHESDVLSCEEKHGDIQLETVTAQLIEILRSTDQVKIIDYGCGYGRLIGHLLTVNKDLLAKLEYIGVDIDNFKLFKTKFEANKTGFAELVKSFQTLTTKELSAETKLKDQIDLFYLINTFHEVEITQVPSLFNLFHQYIKQDGRIVILETPNLIKLEKDRASWNDEDFKSLLSRIYKDDKYLIRTYYSRKGFPLLYIDITGKRKKTDDKEFINILKSVLKSKKNRSYRAILNLEKKNQLDKIDISEFLNNCINHFHTRKQIEKLTHKLKEMKKEERNFIDFDLFL